MTGKGGLSRAGPMMSCQCRRYLHSSVGDNIIIHTSVIAFSQAQYINVFKVEAYLKSTCDEARTRLTSDELLGI